MAATSTKPKSPETMQFVAPAQQTCPSFMDLAMYSLTTYCPDWKNPTKPASYILPPVFDFKHPDKSDEDMEILKMEIDQAKQEGNRTQNELSTLNRPLIDRQSDDGEYIVYHALWKLVQENVQAPVLVIQGLDLDKQKGYFQQIFPNVQSDLQVKFEEMMREYDFVLIGPRIGIIVIEVKSSQFTKAKDFSPSERKLPEDMLKGVNVQLNSFNAKFFHECAGLEKSSVIPVRKILFTPNLEKIRLIRWFNNLDKSDKKKVNNALCGITHWFKEDMINVDPYSLKPALYWSLRHVMEQKGCGIPFDVFQSYGAIIAGLKSALVFRNPQQLEICDANMLSASVAISKQAETIDRQDPLRKLHSPDKPPSAKKCKQNLDLNTVISPNTSRMVLLTPEQQSALNGPPAQFIVGSAGTGKTIILLAKTLELLREGKSVLIFSTPGYSKQYKILTNGYKNCHIVPLEEGVFVSTWCQNFEFAVVEKNLSEWNFPLEINADYLVKEVESNALSISEKVRERIFGFDAFFIDDALDSRRNDGRWKTRNMLCILTLMAMVKTYCTPRMIWVAVDHCPPFDNSDQIYWHLLNRIIARKQTKYICTPLERVMRCSQSVFSIAYSRQIVDQMTIKPIIGHKIVGCSDVLYVSGKTEQLPLLLWERTEQAVEKFEKLGFDRSQMAIIVGSDDIRCRRRPWCDTHLREFYRDRNYNTTDTCKNSDEYRTLNDAYMREYFCWRFRARTVESDSDSLSAPGILTVDTWDNVSSFEWPIVLFCGVTDQRSTDSSIVSYSMAYKRYRACSRANIELLEIIAQRDAQAEAEEQLEINNFHCRLRSALDAATRPSPSGRNETDTQAKPSTLNKDNAIYGHRLEDIFKSLPEKWKELFEAAWKAKMPSSIESCLRPYLFISKGDITRFLNGLQDDELRRYQMILDKFCSVMADYTTKG